MKTINLDENLKQNIIKQFTSYINNMTRCTTNRIDFSTTFDNKTETTNKPTIYISSQAYLKMMLYVRDTSTEIAWHGTVERNLKENWYFIKDVFLYPQKLSAATVSTDQQKYQEWLQNIEDDEVFNTIRFQGHSHVNMGVTPSGTDLNMYNDFLQVLTKEDYYIFTIMNKSGDMTWFIYDLAKNILYETADINIKIICNKQQDLIKTINEEKEKYCEKPVPVGFTNFNNFKSYDEDFYYTHRDIPNYTQNKKTDVNTLIDEINDKYRNVTYTSAKKQFSNKKGDKKK